MNKVVLFLCFAVAIGLTQAQFPSINELRDRMIGKLKDIIKNPFAVLKDLSIFTVQEFISVVQFCLQITQNLGFGFVTFPISGGLWRLEQLAARNGFHLAKTEPRQYKNTTWNYECVNYQARGQVSPVKNQQSCGSCYAFGAVANIESQYLIAHGQNVSFSEQEIVDCSRGMFPGSLNQGCSHGTSNFTFQYFCEHGLHTTGDYPYAGKNQQCQQQIGTPTDLRATEVLCDNEDHLAYLLEKNGPITLYICAGRSFMYYAGGVYDDLIGCNCQINHSVLVVGLLKVPQPNGEIQEQWLIKNSWGPEWGENGFVRVVKNRNMCNMISYPVMVARLGADPIVA